MPDNVVNFNKVRKSKARHQKVLRAAENRVKFGMKKSEKEKAKALTEKLQGHLDGHKRDNTKLAKPTPIKPKPTEAKSDD